MARLLATDVEAAGAHGLDHVAVADGGPVKREPEAAEEPLEPQVGHDRRDQPAAPERAGLGPVAGDQRHQLVAVDLGAGLVGQNEPVRVAVQRDSEMGRSEEHTSELQSLMRTSYAVFCLKTKKIIPT